MLVYCTNEEKVTNHSLRHNGQSCSDLCCDECHSIACTFHEDVQIAAGKANPAKCEKELVGA